MSPRQRWFVSLANAESSGKRASPINLAASEPIFAQNCGWTATAIVYQFVGTIYQWLWQPGEHHVSKEIRLRDRPRRSGIGWLRRRSAAERRLTRRRIAEHRRDHQGHQRDIFDRRFDDEP